MTRSYTGYGFSGQNPFFTDSCRKATRYLPTCRHPPGQKRRDGRERTRRKNVLLPKYPLKLTCTACRISLSCRAPGWMPCVQKRAGRSAGNCTALFEHRPPPTNNSTAPSNGNAARRKAAKEQRPETARQKRPGPPLAVRVVLRRFCIIDNQFRQGEPRAREKKACGCSHRRQRRYP